MLKAMVILHRRADLSAEAFREYSRGTHMPLVAKVPGLKRYLVNHTESSQGTGAPDAIAELWFNSLGEFQTALGTPEGATALADQANYLDVARLQVLFVEEDVGL